MTTRRQHEAAAFAGAAKVRAATRRDLEARALHPAGSGRTAAHPAGGLVPVVEITAGDRVWDHDTGTFLEVTGTRRIDGFVILTAPPVELRIDDAAEVTIR